MNTSKIIRIVYPVIIFSILIFCLEVLFFGIKIGNKQDFDVFYNAGKTALNGKSIYTITGQNHLPFWYFPWVAWFYIPLAILSKTIALIFYGAVSIISAILVVNNLIDYYNPEFKFLNRIFILSLLIPMSFLLILVYQMDYILLGLITLTMYAIDRKNTTLTGILLPFLWIKPHLLIVFTLFVFWRTGWRTVLISIGLSALMLIVETIITPNWLIQMLNLLKFGSYRTDHNWNFTTLPNLLGSQENWVGTANLPFTVLLIILATLIVWKFRSLPTMLLLSFALAASLICAPRAYAYDLPMLIPSMIWLTAKNFKSTFWIWISAAIIPILTRYSSGAYLVTLLVFLFCIIKSYQTTHATNSLNKGQILSTT